MAAKTLPVLTHHNFPQVFPSAIDTRIRAVEKVLGLCDWTEPESHSGACDGGFPCMERATVSHLESGNEFCLSHFREVE
jgi:hypothetical protein